MKIEYGIGTSYSRQIIKKYDTGKEYYRIFFAVGGWSDWQTVVTNFDLKKSSFWFPVSILPWSDYDNGTYQLSKSVENIPLFIRVGKNGSISGFCERVQANDDRVIMTPEGAVTIHFDSLTQITVSGVKGLWQLRSIMSF